jgi:phage host-nuclease inhibitor protein Gam
MMANEVKCPIPKNEVEAARLLSKLEKLKLILDGEQVELDKAIHDLIKKANRKTESVSSEFAEMYGALKSYATKNKDELTEGGKRRSITWVTGTVGWRNTPEGISVPRDTKEKERLIARIIAIRKAKFLRRKWELNIEAMEANPEEATAIEGINRRAASESFFIKFSDGAELKQKIKLRTPSDKDLKALD